MRVTYHPADGVSSYLPDGAGWKGSRKGMNLSLAPQAKREYPGVLDLQEYAGENEVTRLNCLFCDLHEIGHVMQVAYLGMTRKQYLARPCYAEAQAWQIGRAFVRSNMLRAYDTLARRCVSEYVEHAGSGTSARAWLHQASITWKKDDSFSLNLAYRMLCFSH